MVSKGIMWKSEGSEDMKLCLAALESYKTGRITPLLKEELKYHIQSRRMSEGKTELVVQQYAHQPQQQQLRPDEIEKNNRRREQNRKASERFRHKKKNQLDHLQKLCAQLEKRNVALKEEVSKLLAERDDLFTKVIGLVNDRNSND